MASTNQTTHYELSQYIGTDKPTYLVDYNQDMNKIDAGIYAAKSESDVNTSAIGTLSNLTTTAKTNLVAAINEVNSETSSIGVLTDLTTTAKTSVVAAINEVNAGVGNIGDLTDLTTTAKTNLVAAINELDGEIGTLANLTTTSKADLVSATNEVNLGVGTNSSAIGTLSSLSTTTKTDLVSAVNEIYTLVDELNHFTTTESLTGQTWIDGKPVYRKVLEGGSVSAGGTTNLATGITNLDKVIDAYGFAYDSAGDWFPLSRAHKNGNYSITYYWNASGNNFSVETGSDIALSSFVIIVEYTKNTQ